MTWYLVYFTDTGKADSYGSVLADPMPDGFTIRPMSEEETAGVQEGRLMWDADSLTFVVNPTWTPPASDLP